MLQKGANPNSQGVISSILLHDAIFRASLSFKRKRDDVKVYTALTIEALLNAGAKVTDKDKEGKTALDYAKSAEMIKLLKSHGAKEE